MDTFRSEVMSRVHRVYLIKKISTKFGLFIFASIVGMSFVSTLDVLKNTLNVAAQMNFGALFNYTVSALTHTERITYAAMTLSIMAIVWMLSDVFSVMKSRKTQYIEFK